MAPLGLLVAVPMTRRSRSCVQVVIDVFVLETISVGSERPKHLQRI